MENGNCKQIVEFGCEKNGIFRRNIFFEKDDNYEAKKENYILSNDNSNLYECIFSRVLLSDDTYNIIGNICIDFDSSLNNETDYNNLVFEIKKCINYLNIFFGLSYDNYEIYFSGHKGFHLVIPYEVFNITPSENLNIDYKTFVKQLVYECNIKYVDTKIYDNKRLFRIPNTINTKSKLYKVQLDIDQLYDFKFKDMINHSLKPQKLIKAKRECNPKASKLYLNYIRKNTIVINKKHIKVYTKKNIEDLLPCAKELLKTGIQKGSRNNATVMLASSLLQIGIQDEEVRELIIEWNKLNDPPLASKEIDTTINSAKNVLKSGRIYGCSSYKDIGVCIGKKCKLINK